MEINIETQAPLFIRYLDDGSIEIGTEKISDINSRGDLVDIMIKIKKDNPETIITVKPFDPQSAELSVLVRKK